MRHSIWVIGLLAAGCLAGSGRLYVVDQPPPQPQYERVEYRPGYVWVKGSWYRDSDQWRWEQGHYEQERQAQVWRDGYWEPRGNRWHWVEGHWESGNVDVDVRDHRRQPPPEPGTIVVPSQAYPH
jgi:YXWGXW repeat-containing protein